MYSRQWLWQEQEQNSFIPVLYNFALSIWITSCCGRFSVSFASLWEVFPNRTQPTTMSKKSHDKFCPKKRRWLQQRKYNKRLIRKQKRQRKLVCGQVWKTSTTENYLEIVSASGICCVWDCFGMHFFSLWRSWHTALCHECFLLERKDPWTRYKWKGHAMKHNGTLVIQITNIQQQEIKDEWNLLISTFANKSQQDK